MRSSTRKAYRVRMPLVVLAATLVSSACSAGAGRIAAPVEDHSTDAGENHRAAVFTGDDHRLDQAEGQRDRAFQP